MTTLTLELTESLDAGLSKLAHLRRVSKAAAAQEVLQEYLARQKVSPTREQLESHLQQHGTPAPESFAVKAAKYIGIGENGENDLSTNPKHLEGFGE